MNEVSFVTDDNTANQDQDQGHGSCLSSESNSFLSDIADRKI